MTISEQNCWHNLLCNRLLVANHFCVRVIRIFEDPKFFAWAGGMCLLQHQETHECHASFSTSTDSSPMAVKPRIQMCGKRDKWRWSPDSPFPCRLLQLRLQGDLRGSPRLQKRLLQMQTFVFLFWQVVPFDIPNRKPIIYTFVWKIFVLSIRCWKAFYIGCTRICLGIFSSKCQAALCEKSTYFWSLKPWSPVGYVYKMYQ